MIGQLDERITLQSATRTADGAGGFTVSWANLPSVPTVWASIKPVRGSEGNAEDRVNARSTALFTIRNRSDLDESVRIVWRGEVWNIREIRRTGPRPLYLVILAERGVAS